MTNHDASSRRSFLASAAGLGIAGIASGTLARRAFAAVNLNVHTERGAKLCHHFSEFAEAQNTQGATMQLATKSCLPFARMHRGYFLG